MPSSSLSSLSWIILNAIVLILYFNKIINEGMLVVITALYGVLDVFCILIYCPIQSWFLKNRCCVTCRIYNWDYVMLFTLLIFIPNFYTISLIVVSVLLLIKWEISRIIHPERFNESNNNLSCELCKEKSCKLKNNVNKIVNKFIKQ